MSDDKKKREMTPKMFLHRAGGKVSAEGFLSQHREWLQNGELGAVVGPILVKLDNKELMPTPALTEVQQAVLNHILLQDARKAEKSIDEAAASGGTSKPYTATVYDKAGVVQTRKNQNTGEDITLTDSFDLNQRAKDWCDRRLLDGTEGWYAVIENNFSHLSETVQRGDAIARVLRAPRSMATRQVGKKNAPLGQKMKAVGYYAHFSKG